LEKVAVKSQVRQIDDVVSEMLRHDGQQWSTPRDSLRDSETCRLRVAQEGISFLCKTLPTLGKALDEALETGLFIRPRHFKGVVKGANMPAFMQGCFKRIISSDGRLLQDPDPLAIRFVRQVSFMFYKYEIPFTEEQADLAIDNFFNIETSLYLQEDFDNDLVRGSSYHLREVFSGFDPSDISPRHGPGAVYTSERLEEKFDFKRNFVRASNLYPLVKHFTVGGFAELSDRWDQKKYFDSRYYSVSKICLVPKDSRGPRLISSEPLEQMFLQQGLSISLVRWLENSRFSRGHVNFTRQDINQALALSSSKTSEWATLDLKDASDRISLKLVRALFNKTELLPYLEGLRSTHTLTPRGDVVPLSKHAPMGSALCFPILACSIWSLLVVGLAQECKVTLRETEQWVFVYGDDIIVKTEHALSAITILESVGLKVNSSKSYLRGKFRESCGVDAFNGVDVTPRRIRTLWTGLSSDGEGYASYVALLNHLRDRGYIHAAQFIQGKLEATYGVIPYVVSTSGLPGVVVPSLLQAIQGNLERNVRMRRDPSTQNVVVRGPFLTPNRRKTRLRGWARLFRNLCCGAGEEPSVTVLPRSVKLKHGWRHLG
jgi:hypothetical protein